MSAEHKSSDRAQYWQQHIKSWQLNGGSRAQYCRDNQLSYHVFNYWHSKLNSTEQSGSGLVPVVINDSAENQSTSTLQLELPNGMQITGIRAESVTLVSQLIAQL